MAELKLRRSLLYVPGNMPSMLQNIPLFNCDTVQIDLEDAVPYSEKDAARILVRNFLDQYKSRNKEILVRVNGLETKWTEDDLKAILPAMPDGIRLPKADSPEIVAHLDSLLAEHEKALGLKIGHFRILPSIETVQGVVNAIQTARSSPRLIGLAFGAEDYTASMEIERTKSGDELLNARMNVLWGTKAAGIQAIDSIFADVNDMEGLRQETELVKRLGFTGKCMINPRQIDVIHEVFAPKQDEIDYALEVMDAIKRAREAGTGVISLRGKMIDRPVVVRAARVLNTARAYGMVDVIINEEDIHGTE